MRENIQLPVTTDRVFTGMIKREGVGVGGILYSGPSAIWITPNLQLIWILACFTAISPPFSCLAVFCELLRMKDLCIGSVKVGEKRTGIDVFKEMSALANQLKMLQCDCWPKGHST